MRQSENSFASSRDQTWSRKSGSKVCSRRESRQLKHRLAFHNRAVVGKCVKRLNEQAPAARLSIDIAYGSQRHSPAGIKDVHQSLAFAVARQFLLKRPKNFRRDWLQ